MASNLKVRNIECHFILQAGKFKSGGNTKIIKGSSCNDTNNQGLSIQANIKKTSGLMQDECDLTVYGMLQEDIAQLTTLNYQLLQVNRNELLVYAGYDDSLTLIFKGIIMEGQGDFSDPNSPFHAVARVGAFENVSLTPHTNTKGQVTAKAIFQNLATKSALTLVDSAETGLINLYNHILVGGATTQINTLANQLNIDAKSDGHNLYLTKRNDIIKGSVLVKVNADTGLLGYPLINQTGVKFRMRFDPNIRWGGQVQLESISPRTTGKWRIYGLDYTLENLHERFEIEVQGSRYGFGF